MRLTQGSHRRWTWAAMGALVLLAVLERWAVPAWRARDWPTADAKWIWDPGLGPEDGAAGFFAVRDFEVAEGFDKAVLRIAADEAYWISINGDDLGAGAYQIGDPLALYDVSRHLEPGKNRIVVELRTSRGVGGMLLTLEVDGAEPFRLVSDENWRIVDSFQPALADIDSELMDDRAAHEWGPPATGRWGKPVDGGYMPGLRDLVLPGGAAAAVRARVGEPAGRWIQMGDTPDPTNPLGHWVTFDFNHSRAGYLNFVFANKAAVQGLVYAGATLPNPKVDAPTVIFYKAPGLKTWTCTLPRRFRYVTVVALTGVAAARVYAVDPESAAPLLNVRIREGGPFGMKAPSRTAVENEFWREFESVTRLAGGEEL